MRSLLLLPPLIALSTTLSIPTTPSLFQLPSLNTTSPSLSADPWPNAPYHFPLSTKLALWMTITSYGGTGPSNPMATGLLKQLYKQIENGGSPDDQILYKEYSEPGIKATFSVKEEEPGVNRTQAMTVFRRIWGITIKHDAVGIEESVIELGGKRLGHFRLEYLFE